MRKSGATEVGVIGRTGSRRIEQYSNRQVWQPGQPIPQLPPDEVKELRESFYIPRDYSTELYAPVAFLDNVSVDPDVAMCATNGQLVRIKLQEYRATRRKEYARDSSK